MWLKIFVPNFVAIHLVKDGVYEQIDKETLSRLKEIQNLDEETKKHIFATIDAFIAKTKIQSVLK